MTERQARLLLLGAGLLVLVIGGLIMMATRTSKAVPAAEEPTYHVTPKDHSSRGEYKSILGE